MRSRCWPGWTPRCCCSAFPRRYGPTGGSQVLGLSPAQGGFVELTFPEPPAHSDGVLVLFDERGSATAQIRIGRETVPDQPFSPDGRLVAVRSADVSYGGSTRVLTLSTGAEVRRSDGDAVGWLDDGHYLVRTGGSVRVVELGSGRVLNEKRLAPAGGDLTGVWPAALRGTASPGAIVL